MPLALLLAVAPVACGPSTVTPPEVTPDPMTTTVVSGRFEVRFTIDRTTLRTGDNITGLAELRMRAGGTGALSGSGSGLIGFDYMEVGGEHRRATSVHTSDCAPHQIGSDAPITTTLYQAGSGDTGIFPPGRDVRLPAGEWDVTAITHFVDGRGCTGQPYDIRATVRVRVIG